MSFCRCIKKTVTDWAKEIGFIKRSRKLCAFNFLNLMTFGQLGMKLPSLAAMSDALSAKITREGLHYKFNEKSVEFMEKGFSFALKQKVQGAEKLDIELLNPFTRVKIIDSSSWKVNPALKDILPGSGGSASEAACKIQLSYELKSGTVNFCEVMPGRSNDQGYCSFLAEQIEEGELSIADLGYFSLNKFRSITIKKAFFISRFRPSTALFATDSLKRINLIETLKQHKGNNYQADIIMGAGNINVPCRLICQRVPEHEVNKRRRKLKRGAQRRGHASPSKDSRFFCNWLLLITNIPNAILSTEKVWALYRVRWQIELLFKQFKSVLRMHQSNTKNKYRLFCELYGKLIIAVLTHQIHGAINSLLWNAQQRELSFEKFWKRLQERAFTVMQLLFKSFKQAIEYLTNEIQSLLFNCLKLKQRSRPTSLEKLLSQENICFETLKI
jgi:hypothetical protein